MLIFNQVKLEQGVEMLRIFKEHDARTSILDDFEFYDERERSLKERRAKQQASLIKGSPDLLVNDSMNQISGRLAQSLQLQDSVEGTPESNIGAVSRTEVSGSLANDSINTISDSFSEAVVSGYKSNKEISATETGSKNQNWGRW